MWPAGAGDLAVLTEACSAWAVGRLHALRGVLQTRGGGGAWQIRQEGPPPAGGSRGCPGGSPTSSPSPGTSCALLPVAGQVATPCRQEAENAGSRGLSPTPGADLLTLSLVSLLMTHARSSGRQPVGTHPLSPAHY